MPEESPINLDAHANAIVSEIGRMTGLETLEDPVEELIEELKKAIRDARK